MKKKVKKVSMKKKRVSKKVEKSSVGKAKIKKVMHEAHMGQLHSGSKSGPLVTSRKQAIAIALSEAKRATSKKKRK